MNRSLRVALADGEPDTRDWLARVLATLDHRVVAVVPTGHELVQKCQETGPDLVITAAELPDMDGLAAADAVCRCRPVPVIVLTAREDPELMQRPGAGCVFGCLVKPLKSADLAPAITLAVRGFEQVRSLYQEAADLRQALDDRKAIERAKGAVMKRLGVDEPEAFRRINRLARNKNLKLIQMAQRVLGADEVFQELERC